MQHAFDENPCAGSRDHSQMFDECTCVSFLFHDTNMFSQYNNSVQNDICSISTSAQCPKAHHGNKLRAPVFAIKLHKPLTPYAKS